MTTLEQHILLSRLNNGPKKKVNGKPMSYRDEVLEGKADVIEGHIITTQCQDCDREITDCTCDG